MLHIQSIQSFDRPELSPYLTMKRPLDHQRAGIFVAEGEKVVRRLLESRLTIISILLPEKWLQAYEPLLETRPEKIDVFIAEKTLLENFTGFIMYQGVLAVGQIPSPALLENVPRTSSKALLFVAIDGITNATNLGVIVRNAAAFGAHALLVGQTSCSPFLRRAVRNSMGSVFQLPIVEATHLAQTLQDLRGKNIRCIAAHPDLKGKTLCKSDFSGDCCIVLGNEGDGISPEVIESCDETIAIPMAIQVDSLNVASAAAVFFYEVNRQRGKI